MDFDAILERYEKPIYNLIYRLIGDSEEAADLTQDTFIAAYASMSSFRGEASIYSWLYRIAVNRCKNKIKEHDRRRAYETDALDDIDSSSQFIGSAGSDMGVPHAIVEQKELAERIERAISELPGDYRIVAVLRDLQGLSYDEIAQATGLSVDVVRTRIARARAMLRRKLEPLLES